MRPRARQREALSSASKEAGVQLWELPDLPRGALDRGLSVDTFVRMTDADLGKPPLSQPSRERD